MPKIWPFRLLSCSAQPSVQIFPCNEKLTDSSCLPWTLKLQQNCVPELDLGPWGKADS